jgi:hypothetical protein
MRQRTKGGASSGELAARIPARKKEWRMETVQTKIKNYTTYKNDDGKHGIILRSMADLVRRRRTDTYTPIL